ncbi:hypothetical protein [Alkalibacillus haloalkaliphilus]|uniref:hypothetical protein n=1 Tax=Alkalibacillus haloalkaliphilus TaxID=94136 RepID=UPI0029354B2C|nr:hypothetical protein [Alkalibacillus haloalkaliphilus]MDV2581576.1 hypothetical protein [Alkalibacillus haloalkaliphilus]
MYFDGDTHRRNFYSLVRLYRYNDVQNLSATYVAAHPTIFKCIDNDKELGGNNNPITLIKDSNGDYSHPALTGASKQMCLFAASLFNGHPVQLTDVLGNVNSHKLLQVLIQALVITSPTDSELCSEIFKPDPNIYY